MKESYLEKRIYYLDQIEQAYKRSNMLRHALRAIQVEFTVYVSPTNCVWKGEPQKYEWKQSTERPVCG
jgi:hypothetical protein